MLGAGILFVIAKYLFPSYLSEKGKNLATKEDIGAITDKIELVKTDYAKVLEEFRNNNQLQLLEIEREKNIKKEVYLEAVEAINRSHTVIARLADLNIDEKNISSQMISDGGVIAKVHIVGSAETVKSVTKFMAAIGTANLELMLERSVLVARKNEIDMLEDCRKKSANEIDRYIGIMKNINLEGITDQRLWDTINTNVEFEKNERDNHVNSIANLWAIQNKEHVMFSRKCMDRFFEISELLPESVLSVRRELNMEISSEAYLDIYRESIETGRHVFNKFLNEVANHQA